MNIFNKKLVLVVAGCAALFATGCTKKPARPTPDQTVMGGGAGAEYATDTSGGATGFGNTTGFSTGASSMNSGDGLDVRSQGDLNNNELRNVPELQSVYFDFDRSAIKQSEYSKIQAVKDYLAKNPTYKVIFEGHCDWRGTAEYNMALGDRRANSARKYAVSLGIDPNKVQVRSVGSTHATERGSEADMAKDRRAEVVVLVK